jgi:hypothetical protein
MYELWLHICIWLYGRMFHKDKLFYLLRKSYNYFCDVDIAQQNLYENY